MIQIKILFADFLKIHIGRSQESWVMIQQNNQVESTLLDFKDTASGFHMSYGTGTGSVS